MSTVPLPKSMDKMLGTFFSNQYIFRTTVFRPDNSLEVGDLIDFTIRPPSLSRVVTDLIGTDQIKKSRFW